MEVEEETLFIRELLDRYDLYPSLGTIGLSQSRSRCSLLELQKVAGGAAERTNGGDGEVGGWKKGAGREDVAQLVRPIHGPMKRPRRTDVVKREENYYDYHY